MTTTVDNAIDLPWQSGAWDKVITASTLTSGDTQFPYNTVWDIGGRKSICQNELDSSSRFDTIPTIPPCKGRTDRQTDRHMTTAYTALAQRRAVKTKNSHAHVRSKRVSQLRSRRFLSASVFISHDENAEQTTQTLPAQNLPRIRCSRGRFRSGTRVASYVAN